MPINHLEGHALSARMTGRAEFPFLLLLVSGGHTQLISVEGVGRYRRLGTTIDDAAGEAFDKTAKLLGLPQPGGPSIERLACEGRPDRYDFPEPLARREGCDFSLSGLKTAVRIAAAALPSPTRSDVADIARSFQDAVARHVAARAGRAMDLVGDLARGAPRLVVAGGVAANEALRRALYELCQNRGWELIVPPVQYCTDNAAMIAWAGLERLAAGLGPLPEEALAFAPRSRWPLAPVPEDAAFGGGRRGPKA
jgi:N6-L-threonylcarbamoyladenine synthase